MTEGFNAAEAAALRKIQAAHKLLQDAKVEARDARKDANTAVDAAGAHLKTQIETGIPAGTTEEETAAIKVKLTNVELAWQNYEEAKEGAKELRKVAREGVNAARQHLAQTVKDSQQLTLPGVSP